MSEIKALDNLRKLASDFRSDVYKRDEADYVLEIADEIEREISERFMLLPVDANNEPIHVGDTVAGNPLFHDADNKSTKVVCMLVNSDGWAIGDRDPFGHWYGPLQLEHVKPDPLKELLEELASEARQDSRDFSVEPWCDAVRELMGGDGR